MIFFKVHEFPGDKLGTVYTRDFQRTGNHVPGESDLVLSSTRMQFDAILDASPTHVVLRVHADRFNRNISEGKLYDENFEEASPDLLITGSPLLFTVTPDEFDAVAMTRNKL